MEASRSPTGDLVFHGVPDICAETLRTLPAVLESDDPRIRDRLLPRAYEDDELEQEWRRIGAPELEHLFVSRTRLMKKDLRSLARTSDGGYRLSIARVHENAWLSGLNAARHALFILNDLEAADMARDPDDLEDPQKAMALLRIHLLAWMQELMMRTDEEFG